MAESKDAVDNDQKVLPAENNNSRALMTGKSDSMAMISMALEKGADTQQLQMLMDLRDREAAFQAKNAFTAAMADFKKNAPELVKDTKVSYSTDRGDTEYHHVSLHQASSKIAEALSKVGISHRWDIDQPPGGAITVTCILTHEFGHSESTPMTSLADSSGGKNSIQAIASAITYMQRYTLLAAVGLAAAAQDNDALVAKPDKKPIEFYPQDRFDANFPNWEKQIASGERTKKGLIAFIKSKAEVSDKQIKMIEGIKIKEGGEQ